MATELSKLRVSLTKHGAHKVAYLIQEYSPEEVLDHLKGDFHNINIERSQTKGTLSIHKNSSPPQFWYDIKKFETEDIIDFTFIAIVFSHVDLIHAMIKGFENNCTFIKGDVLKGKAYTNFAHTIEEFGYQIQHTSKFITFDISRIFHKFYLIESIQNLLKQKLSEAGWDGSNSMVEECLNNNLNKAFGLNRTDFKKWLNNKSNFTPSPVSRAKRNFRNGLKFNPGHRPKTEDDTIAKPKAQNQKVTLLHNKIQTRVYDLLSAKYPDCVGTETYSDGGSIDLVRKLDNNTYDLYEIKTSDSARINVRLGLSQLLEYAYWGTLVRVNSLVIIGPAEPDNPTIDYLNHLRSQFHLPIFYQHFDIKKNLLGNTV